MKKFLAVLLADLIAKNQAQIVSEITAQSVTLAAYLNGFAADTITQADWKEATMFKGTAKAVAQNTLGVAASKIATEAPKQITALVGVLRAVA